MISFIELINNSFLCNHVAGKLDLINLSKKKEGKKERN